MWDLGPKAQPLEVQPQPAEEFDRIIQTKAPALEQLEFVVKSRDEATGMPPIEIVENAVLPVMQRIKELIKTAQPRSFDLLSPALERSPEPESPKRCESLRPDSGFPPPPSGSTR